MDLEANSVNMTDTEEPDEKETTAEAEGASAENANENEPEAPEADTAANVTPLPQNGMQHMRMLEAMLFASVRPLSEKELAERMPQGIDVGSMLEDLRGDYEKRGVSLEKVADKWTFRTASDLNYLFQKEAVEPKRLSKAGIETLSIIAYHQPVTRAEIEDIRGVTVSKGTIDLLLELGWIRLRGRKRTPGRPITYGTTDLFLEHFGLENVSDLPGMDDLKAAGLLSANLPPSFLVPDPSDELSDEEDPLEDEEEPDLLDALEIDMDDEAEESAKEDPEAEDDGVEIELASDDENLEDEAADDDLGEEEASDEEAPVEAVLEDESEEETSEEEEKLED